LGIQRHGHGERNFGTGKIGYLHARLTDGQLHACRLYGICQGGF
jgi:hypothetical protein